MLPAKGGRLPRLERKGTNTGSLESERIVEKVHLLSLGCPKNLVDSELMLGALTRAGFEIAMAPEDAQVLVVNTCAFIESAKKESLDAIMEAVAVKRSGAGKRLVVAGCMAQRYGGELREQIRVLDMQDRTERNISLPHGWRIWHLSWAADGNALFVAAQTTLGYFIGRVALDGKTQVLLDRGRAQWLSYPCPSPDGRYLAFSQSTFDVNAWLLENF